MSGTCRLKSHKRSHNSPWDHGASLGLPVRGGGAENKKINDMIASGTSSGRMGLPDDNRGAVASLLAYDSA